MDNPETQVTLKNKMMIESYTTFKKVGVSADACCIGLGCLTFVEVYISEMVHIIKPWISKIFSIIRLFWLRAWQQMGSANWSLTPLSTARHGYSGASFIGTENMNALKKTTTKRNIESTGNRARNYSGDGHDCTCRCKSNYQAIVTTTTLVQCVCFKYLWYMIN